MQRFIFYKLSVNHRIAVSIRVPNLSKDDHQSVYSALPIMHLFGEVLKRMSCCEHTLRLLAQSRRLVHGCTYDLANLELGRPHDHGYALKKQCDHNNLVLMYLLRFGLLIS